MPSQRSATNQNAYAFKNAGNEKGANPDRYRTLWPGTPPLYFTDLIRAATAVAAERLGMREISGTQQIWLGNRWFTVIGTLDMFELAPVSLLEGP